MKSEQDPRRLQPTCAIYRNPRRNGSRCSRRSARRSIDDLFAIIPAEYRLTRDLDVPRQQAESEIIDYFKAAADKNATDYASFLGAGCTGTIGR